MTIMKITTTIAATLLLGTAAFAQDSKPFDGLYGGVEAGVDWTRLAGDVKRDRSFYYGGIIGYRSQMDNGFVTGIEGTFGDSGYNNGATGTTASYEWSTSLLLGSTFGDGDNLLFAKAGYAQTRFNPTAAADDSFSDGGWRFGGGYERAISNNMSLRLSGDYTTYGDDVGQWQTKAGVLVKF